MVIKILKKIKRTLSRLFYKYKKIKEKKISTKATNDARIDNHTILFESEGDFADNARALYEHMLFKNINKRYHIIWIVDNPDLYEHHNNVEFISRKCRGKKALYDFYLKVGSAKYVFFTHPWWYEKQKDEQIIINLWHGTPLKAKGKDIHDKFDYILVPSEFCKDLFRKFIGVKDSQFITAGFPRNDLLFNNKGNIKNIISIEENPKVILMMTTFKQAASMHDSSFAYPYVLPFINDVDSLNNLNSYLKKENVKLIIKIHHLQKIELISKLNLSNIIYVEDDELFAKDIQLYELVGQSDALITDYSSIMFDYMMLDKQIAYFVNDLEDYKKNRGFLVDNIDDYMIGEKMTTINDFKKFIKHVKNNEDNYKAERKSLGKKMNKYKYNNCERILNYFNIK